MTSPPVHGSLRTWFVIHFIVDMVFAIPLFLFPREFLELFGWRSIDPLAARLVAAALFGIGIESFLGRSAGPESFRNFLNLKIIWSAAATIGILVSMIQSGRPSLPAEWLLLLTFLLFNVLWVYYRLRLGSIRAP